MPYRDMPEPLPLRKLLGPSVILAGLGVGSGEYIIWPFITSIAGPSFLWAAVLGVTVQYFLNMEIERYTLAKSLIVSADASMMPIGITTAVVMTQRSSTVPTAAMTGSSAKTASIVIGTITARRTPRPELTRGLKPLIKPASDARALRRPEVSLHLHDYEPASEEPVEERGEDQHAESQAPPSRCSRSVPAADRPSSVAEAFDHHIRKGCIYFAMGFAVFVEMINQRLRCVSDPVQSKERSADTGPQHDQIRDVPA